MKVTVVGAGPAGSSFATTGIAAERGHEITFFDKQDDIGGLNLAKKALAKNNKQLVKHDVNLKLGHYVSTDDLLHGNIDSVVVATGIALCNLKIQGANDPK
ncbi:unnamed protein product, partial [Aphanomyces euteiches]